MRKEVIKVTNADRKDKIDHKLKQEEIFNKQIDRETIPNKTKSPEISTQTTEIVINGYRVTIKPEAASFVDRQIIRNETAIRSKSILSVRIEEDKIIKMMTHHS